MTTASQAYDVIKGRLEAAANRPIDASGNRIPLRWQNEDADSDGGTGLPDPPRAWAYTEFVAEPSAIASYGGGRGASRYRNPARIESFVFVPRGEGLKAATDIAEQIAALFRSYRDNDISCFEATVHPGGNGADIKPPGVQSDVDNYYWAAAEVVLFFDQVG